MNKSLRKELLRKESHDAMRGASVLILIALGVGVLSIIAFPFMSPIREMGGGFEKSPYYYVTASLAVLLYILAIWYFWRKRMSPSEAQMLESMVGKIDHSVKARPSQPMPEVVYWVLAFGIILMISTLALVTYINHAYPEMAERVSETMQTPTP